MTDSELLNLAKDDASWTELHQLCLERSIAEQFARALEKSADEMAFEAKVWASVLHEMHPGLRLVLPPVPPRSTSSPIGHRQTA